MTNEPQNVPDGQNMSLDQFLDQLPELFARSQGSRISEDPEYAQILRDNPTAAELVRDLEYIAEQARMLLQPEHEIEPSADLWSKIQSSIDLDKGDKSKSN